MSDNVDGRRRDTRKVKAGERFKMTPWVPHSDGWVWFDRYGRLGFKTVYDSQDDAIAALEADERRRNGQ